MRSITLSIMLVVVAITITGCGTINYSQAEIAKEEPVYSFDLKRNGETENIKASINEIHNVLKGQRPSIVRLDMKKSRDDDKFLLPLRELEYGVLVSGTGSDGNKIHFLVPSEDLFWAKLGLMRVVCAAERAVAAIAK